jgi:hypothetical protein
VERQAWPAVEAVARELAPRRADVELAQLSAYLAAHRDADDFFALLDELAGPAGAVLTPGGANGFTAVRDACQPLRTLPADELPAAVAFAARLLRYHVSKLPPAPRPMPVPVRAPVAAPRPAGGLSAPPARPALGRPAAAGAPAAPRPPRPPGPLPAAAERRGPAPAGPRPATPSPAVRPPAERPPVQPAAEQPRPEPPPRRPATMDDMLRALQAQFSGERGGAAEERSGERVESKRDRLRREQEEIRERYRRQQEEAEQARGG